MPSRFYKLEDDAPEVPSYTCGFIDPVGEVIIRIRDSFDTLKRSPISGLKDALLSLQLQIDTAVGHCDGDGNLEKLRTMNEELREGGIYWRQAAKDLCQVISQLEHHIEVLKAEPANAEKVAMLDHPEPLVLATPTPVVPIMTTPDYHVYRSIGPGGGRG